VFARACEYAPSQLDSQGGCAQSPAQDCFFSSLGASFLGVFSLAGSFRCFFFLLFVGALYVVWVLFYVGLFSVRIFFFFFFFFFLRPSPKETGNNKMSENCVVVSPPLYPEARIHRIPLPVTRAVLLCGSDFGFQIQFQGPNE
jgi:hypothetical protein